MYHAPAGWQVRFSIFSCKIDDNIFEDADKFVANDFSFLFGIGDTFERLQKTFAGVDIFETNMKIFSKDALNNFFLTGAQLGAIAHI